MAGRATTSILAPVMLWSSKEPNGAKESIPAVSCARKTPAPAKCPERPGDGQNAASDGETGCQRGSREGRDTGRAFRMEGGNNYLGGGLLSWSTRLTRSLSFTLIGSLWLLRFRMMVVTLGSISGVVSR